MAVRIKKCIQFRHILAYAVEDEFSSLLPSSEWSELLSSSVEVVDEFFDVPAINKMREK